MTRFVTVGFLAAMLAVSGCAETAKYPMSDDQCLPTDPVQQIDAKDCIVPGT